MAPLHALAQVWRDRTGEESVRWDTRSLKAFAEDPLDRYANYDLIIFDYPFAGEALAAGWVRDLSQLLPEALLAEQRAGAIGRTYESFAWQGKQAALPIDAATQVSAWRADLMERAGEGLPNDWSETVALAARRGAVAMPMTPTAIWGTLITLSANAGAPPMRSPDSAFDRGHARASLKAIAALAEHMPEWTFVSSPVAILNKMSTSDEIAYCPLTYGYSTYGMRGYAEALLNFGDIRVGPGGAAGAILGGAGIGVLSGSKHAEEAALLASWLTSHLVQATLYTQFGGQPAARTAWDAPANDRLTNGFYGATRASMEGCYHRPNIHGFHAFQTRSANALHRAVRESGDFDCVLEIIDEDWSALAMGCTAW